MGRKLQNKESQNIVDIQKSIGQQMSNYDVCHIMGFVAYDICYLMMFVGCDVFHIKTFVDL